MEKKIFEKLIKKKYNIDNPYGELPEGVESKLWIDFKEGKEDLRSYFIIKYSPLVKYVAAKVALNIPDTIEFEDLVSFGTFGLIDAIEKYDPHKGIKFKTYGITRIRGQIYDELRSLDWVPRSIRQKYKAIEEQRKKYFDKNSENMSSKDIAKALDISVDDVESILNSVSDSKVSSLDDSFFVNKSEGEVSLLETVQAPTQSDPYELIEKSEIRKVIAKQIQLLPEKEKKVLVLYYYEELTLKEIGAVLSVTESRVSQLHTNAIRNIRNALEKIKKSLV